MAKFGQWLNHFGLVAVIGGQMAIAPGLILMLANPASAQDLAPHSSFPDLGDWVVQNSTSPVQVTGVRLETTEEGLQIQLETTGELPTPISNLSGNTLTIEIPNAVLALPNNDEFLQSQPAEGIATVRVTAPSEETLQIVVTGVDAPPSADITGSGTALTVRVTSNIFQEGEEIEIVVTGDFQETRGYVQPTATTATRTDTPLRDTPQSIQAIPQRVLEDQGVVRLNDAIRNVSGVLTTSNGDPRGQTFAIRGFEGAPVLRNGRRAFNNTGNSGFSELANIEQVEVLKGPASILAGFLQPGGAINLVTERPLSETTYEIGLRAGNRTLIEPSIDFSGPLTEDGRVLYRINMLHRNEDSFRDLDRQIERFFVAPVVSWAISDSTDLLVELEYNNDSRPYDIGIFSINGGEPDIPFDRVLTYPDLEATSESTKVGYEFEHRFSENWKVRNSTYYTRFDTFTFNNNAQTFGPGLFDSTTGTINLIPGTFDQPSDTVEIQTNIVGEFSTGSIEHTLLAGVDFYQRQDLGSESKDAIQLVDFGGFSFPSPTILDTLNIFDPDYDSLTDFDPDTFLTTFTTEGRTENWGFYVQDQIKLLDNLILLAGLRFDTVYQEQTLGVPISPNLSNQSDSTSEAFTPRVGLVYQPIEEFSLYTSYSTSFQPNTGVTFVGDLLDPEEGEQFEVGIRAEVLDGNLVATLAFFDIDRSNIAITDSFNPGFLVGEGGENIQGIELDIVGEILPGWNLVANYAYLDSEITESDNPAAIGNRQRNIPEHNFNLWTSYTVQSGSLEGLNVSIGGNFVGERFGDESNTISLDSYFLTNAAIGYSRDNWRVALNFRNLFDIEYIEGSVSDGFVLFPGEGFTVLGSFSATF